MNQKTKLSNCINTTPINFIFRSFIFLMLLLNLSCATLLPTEQRIFADKIEYKKDAKTWKKNITDWVTFRYGERGLSTKKEENERLMFVLGMGYNPINVMPTAGSCHFIFTVGYSNQSLDLSFENIFFVNGYGRVGTTSRMHDGESGQNNMKELDAIIERCIKVAAIDLKEFVK